MQTLSVELSDYFPHLNAHTQTTSHTHTHMHTITFEVATLQSHINTNTHA